MDSMDEEETVQFVADVQEAEVKSKEIEKKIEEEILVNGVTVIRSVQEDDEDEDDEDDEEDEDASTNADADADANANADAGAGADADAV